MSRAAARQGVARHGAAHADPTRGRPGRGRRRARGEAQPARQDWGATRSPALSGMRHARRCSAGSSISRRTDDDEVKLPDVSNLHKAWPSLSISRSGSSSQRSSTASSWRPAEGDDAEWRLRRRRTGPDPLAMTLRYIRWLGNGERIWSLVCSDDVRSGWGPRKGPRPRASRAGEAVARRPAPPKHRREVPPNKGQQATNAAHHRQRRRDRRRGHRCMASLIATETGQVARNPSTARHRRPSPAR